MLLTYFVVSVICAISDCPANFGEPGDHKVEPKSGRQSRFFRRLANQQEFDLAVDVGQDKPEPFVVYKDGAVHGYFQTTISGREIYAFEGVPFGEAPVGEKRFQPPEPVKPWRGILETRTSAPYCLQMHAFFLNRILGSEDCLKLNLYTPKLSVNASSPDPLLPVIVFIHGGSFQFSSAKEYGPAYLLEKDVVLVTLNYRLGILGFMSYGDQVIPGNNGLRDQALGLKWVHENIRNFGGDPTKVTLLGESAGAVSVHLHMLSSQSTKDWFQRAVAMSGTAFNFWSIQSHRAAKNYTQRAAKLAKCPTENSQELLKCMKSRNPNFLVANQIHLLDYFPSYPSILFGPVLEQPGPTAYLTETPQETYSRNASSKVPLLVTTTSAEGEVAIIGLPSIFRFKPFRTKWEEYGPIFLGYNRVEGINVDSVTQAVNAQYFGDGMTSRTLPLSGFSNMTTERYFAPGILKTLETNSRVAPTYSWIFGYRGRYGIHKAFGLDRGDFRVGHVEDQFYLFNMTQYSQGLKLTDPEYEPTQFVVNALVEFAKTGIPAVLNMPDFTLPPVNPDNIEQLMIDTTVEFVPYPERLRRGVQFWNSLNATDVLP